MSRKCLQVDDVASTDRHGLCWEQAIGNAVLPWVAQEQPEGASMREAAALALAAMAHSGLAPPSLSAAHLFRQPGLRTPSPTALQLIAASFGQGQSLTSSASCDSELLMTALSSATRALHATNDTNPVCRSQDRRR